MPLIINVMDENVEFTGEKILEALDAFVAVTGIRKHIMSLLGGQVQEC